MQNKHCLTTNKKLMIPNSKKQNPAITFPAISNGHSLELEKNNWDWHDNNGSKA